MQKSKMTSRSKRFVCVAILVLWNLPSISAFSAENWADIVPALKYAHLSDGAAAIAISKNKRIAFANSDPLGGIVALELSNMEKPVPIGKISGDSLHRVQVITLSESDELLFVGSECNSLGIACTGFQVIDVGNPYKMKTLTTLSTVAGGITDIQTLDANTILVAENGKIAAYDIHNPRKLKKIGSLSVNNAILHMAVVAKDSRVYITTDNALLVANFKNSSKPILIGRTKVPNATGVAVSSDNKRAFVGSRGDFNDQNEPAGIRLFQLDDPNHPVYIGTVYKTRLIPAPLILLDDRLLILKTEGTPRTSDDQGGLRILDVRQPEKPIVTETIELIDADQRSRFTTDESDGNIVVPLYNYGFMFLKSKGLNSKVFK